MLSRKVLSGCVLALIISLLTLVHPVLRRSDYPGPLFPADVGAAGLAQGGNEKNVVSIRQAVREPSNEIEGAEVVAKRTLTSKTYQLGPDGYKTIISTNPIHFVDEEGAWQEINTTLLRQADGDYSSETNLIKARFPAQLGAGQGIELGLRPSASRGPASSWAEAARAPELAVAGSSEGSIRWQPRKLAYSGPGATPGSQELFTAAVANVSGTVSGSEIVYAGAYPGVVEQFSVVPGGIKHALILSVLPEFLPAAPALGTFLEYEVELSLPPDISLYVGGVAQPAGFSTSSTIELRRGKKEVIGYVAAPFAFEAGNPKVQTGGTHRIQREPGRILVTVQIPLDWLAAPERVFPVVIDPTTTAVPLQDTFMAENLPTTVFDAWGTMYAGYDSAFGFGRERALMHWNVDSIPASSTINSSSIKLYMSSSQGIATCELTFYRMLTYWFADFVSWNGRYYNTTWGTPGAGSAGIDYDGTTDLGFGYSNETGVWHIATSDGFNDWVQGWINGTYANYGVILRPNDLVDCERGFRTWDDGGDDLAPTLEVDYTFTGGTPALLSDNLAQTHTYPNPEDYYQEDVEGGAAFIFWRGTAVRPLDQSDYDLWLHTASDFSQPQVDSVYGIGRVDYTLTRETVNTTGYPRVVRYSGSDDYNIHYMIRERQINPPAALTVTLGSHAVWYVAELYLGSPGSWQVVVTPLAGNPDLGLAIHSPDSADYHTRSSALASSDNLGQNLVEQIEFEGKTAGWYGLVIWSNRNTGVSQQFLLEVKEPASKAYLPVVMKDYAPPQGPFGNGSFETAARWILGGELERERTTTKARSGNYSLQLGHDGETPCLGKVPCAGSGSQCESAAFASQGFDVPNVGSPSLSFYYQLYTYDHKPDPSPPRAPDYFRAYIRHSGGEQLVYEDDLGWVGSSSYQCYNLNQKNTWQFVSSIDLSPYKGQTVELVFKVANGGHNYWNTWAYIDDVTCTGC